jgi:GNAT superfamily N-acetyltransferase
MSTCDITYRAATDDDLPTLALLRFNMQVDWCEHPEEFEPAREPYIANYCDEMRKELLQGRLHAWLAEDDGVPVAAVSLITWIVPPNLSQPHRVRGQVSNVYTCPAYRRQGISRALMGLLMEWARTHDVYRLILWASEMGQPLYTSLGFNASDGMEISLV